MEVGEKSRGKKREEEEKQRRKVKEEGVITGYRIHKQMKYIRLVSFLCLIYIKSYFFMILTLPELIDIYIFIHIYIYTRTPTYI